MSVRLEHANIATRDLDGMIRFVQAAFPDFRVRWEGTNLAGARYLHIGSDETYLALQQATDAAPERWVPYGGRPGLNHLGFEVDDAEAVRARLLAAGYQDSTFPNAHPYRKRVYFHDAEGNDWEFVEYFSDDPKKRHDYELPDLPAGRGRV